MKFVALVCAFVAVTSVKAGESYEDKNFKITKKDAFDKEVISIKGLFRSPLAEKFKELTSKIESRKEIEIRFNSVGGSIVEAEELISSIKELKGQGYSVTTVVDYGDMCASSCVPVYVQGDKRVATSVSVFMFHGVAITAVTNIPDVNSTQVMIDSYKEAGIHSNWIQEHVEMGVWSTPNETYYNGRELYDNGSGFVTELLKHRKVFAAYSRQYADRPR